MTVLAGGRKGLDGACCRRQRGWKRKMVAAAGCEGLGAFLLKTGAGWCVAASLPVDGVTEVVNGAVDGVLAGVTMVRAAWTCWS